MELGKKTYIMGILNVTPDFFSDGGKYLDPCVALNRALEMRDQGADIIDVGAQSTRPGFSPVTPEEEWNRIEPVLDLICGRMGIPVSVDTFYPQVAEKSLQKGADIINDVTGFCDEKMIGVAKQWDCGCIVMHNGNEKGKSEDAVTRVRSFFDERLRFMTEKGIPPERMCFDPGIGFGKEHEENLRLIRCVAEIKIPGLAFLMAASRKRVIGIPCGNPPFSDRLPGTIAAHTIAIVGGADILRVHDVKEAVQSARVADAILGKG